MPSIPWHTSGPSRALDPYSGLRLSDEHLPPLVVPPWKRDLIRQFHSNMSLIPWHTSGPSRTLDPYLGLRLGNEEFLDPLSMVPWERSFRPFRSYSWDAVLPTDAESAIKENKDKFEVNVDVQHFKPDEIKVTSSGNTLIIECKHEERPDEHGYIFRSFVRKYVIPEDHDLSQIESHVSADGVLSVTAPKIPADGNVTRKIPVQHTGILKRAIK